MVSDVGLAHAIILVCFGLSLLGGALLPETKYSLHETQVCARGVFRSQTPRVYYPPKDSLTFGGIDSLVSACKGKNKGKYTRL